MGEPTKPGRADRPTRAPAPGEAKPRPPAPAGGGLEAELADAPALDEDVAELVKEERDGKAPPPPPSPNTPEVVATTTVTGDRPASAPAQIATDDGKQKPSSSMALAYLLAQARDAAKAKDCARVAELSKRVAALDAGYHRRVFVRDADIAACR